MAVSKVTLVQNNVSQTLIDVSNDTATVADVAQGKTFHLATGEQAVGTATGTTKPTQTKTATPSTSQQTITPDAGYELASVTVEAVTNAIDANIQAGNIRNGVSILGVTGNYGGGGSSTLVRELIDRSITTLTASDLSGITSIGDYAFMGCQMLSSVTLSNDVTSIGNESFSNCTSLTSVPMTNNITSVGMGAFTACTNITTFNWSSSCTSIPSSCFSGCGFTQVIIPDTVTYIGNYAFASNQNLETITLGSGISQLGDDISQNCSNLDYVTIMSSTPPQCDSQYPFDINIMFIRVPDAAVATYQSTWPWSQYAIQGLSAPIILTTPASEFRFDVDGHITKYAGSRSKVVTPISYDKVSTSTTFNGIYAYLEDFASQASSFGGLQVIISADGDINNAVTFDENDIGTAASQFGSYAYIMGVDAVNQDYSNLSNISWLIQPDQFPVYINGTVIYDNNQWGNYWNNSLVQETKVFYGTGTVISYTDGNTYSVTQIDNNSFDGGNITNLTISEGVTYIGANFTQDGTIQKVKFPSTLTDLGYATFTGCSSLYTVEIAQGNTNIILDNHIVYKVDSVAGTRTLLFALCGYGGSVSLYNTVTEIRDYAFSGSAYGSIQINNVGSISLGSNLFTNSQIQSINFTNLTDTISINSDSFNNASNLQTLTLPPCGGGSLSLHNLTALYSVDISRSGISSLTLNGLANLGTITIPASVTSIIGQISNCPNLTVITVDATVPPTAQSDCFDQSNVTTVYVPQGTLSAYQSATGWSTRNLVEQGGPTPPVGGPYATVYFDSMGQPGTYQVDLSQVSYTLDFSSDSSVYGVDIGMTVSEWRNANGSIIGYTDNILARQFNSGNTTYICYVSDGEISIPSARIPSGGGTNSGTCTVSLPGAGISSQTATLTITDYSSYYECTIVPRSGTDFVQIDMTLTDDLRAVSSYTLTTSSSVPLPYIVNSNTITGTTETLTGDLVLPSSYSLDNGDVVEGNDYAITQISLQSDHANDFANITQLTIPSNYTSADIQGSMDNLTMLILEGNSLQYFYFASTSITTLRCMTTVPPTIDAQTAAYIDSISNLTTIEVPYSAISAYQSSNWGLTNKTITYIPGTEPQDTVTVYRDDGQGNYLIDGVVNLTSVSNVMPATVNGQIVDSGEYCVMGSGVTNLIINTQDLIYATWLFNGTDAQSQNIDFTIPRGAALNYGLGSDPINSVANTHFVMNDYNQTYILQTYNVYPGQVGYAKLMDYSKNVVTSGSCEMYYMDPVTMDIYWKITDTNNIETYIKAGQTNIGGDYYTTIEVVNQPTIPNSADEFSFNGNSITGYYGSGDSPITPASYDTSSAYTDGALVSMSEWNTFYSNMENDSVVGTVTLMVEGESNTRTYTTGTDVNDLETQVGSVNLYIQSIVLADTVQASGSGYVIDMVSNALQFPIKIGNDVLYGTDQVTSWYDGHSSVYNYQFAGNYTAFIDGYSTLVTGIESIDSGNSSTWLSSIVISEGITTIGDNAFDSQTMMTSVDLPSTITTIGNYAFSGLTLSSIIIRATTPPTLGTDSFDAGVTIQVPAEALTAYQNDSSYSGFTIVAIQ